MKPVAQPDSEPEPTTIVHASCISVAGSSALITGPSGSGKSALALQMMALGADLVADDRVHLRAGSDAVSADAVDPIRGLIEARGIGLLKARAAGPTPVLVVVDLGQSEPKRLPDLHSIELVGQTVPLLKAKGVPNLASALMQFLKMGRVDPQWPCA